ncbi:hypothetical protein NBE98_02370 [Clostridium swellfunianum]|uniref:CBO0543 family protein n=1 Tax=Clostridium swellfunianum TaxID=1367462 RepID=UPI00202F2F6A|nr:CBO0543 family protein [Clostridium swellfunianum]MCM0647218.1 hypothetical protein [Clostridium swellfunianum]
MKFTLIRSTMALLWGIGAYKLSDWKNWRKYYPTMLFFACGDLIYKLVFCNKLLWAFEADFLVGSLNELFVIFTVFFFTTLIFLSKYPKKLSHQIIYIVIWIAIYMVIEIFTTSIGMQKNYNGWNLWWSLLHNSIQFPLLRLHYINPFLAWIIAFMFLFFIMSRFNLQFFIGMLLIKELLFR